MSEPPEPGIASDQVALEADLAAWGRVITLETRGRRSGLARRVSIGFVDEADGSLLVAASAETTQWALNLLADPACHVERQDTVEACTAIPLYGDARHRAVQSLILKYGTPSEVLGAGPAFRLQRSGPRE